MKSAVLKELQRAVGRRATLTVFGDRWVLTSRTGRREIFDDVEALAGVLVSRGLVPREAPATGPAGARLGEILDSGSRPGGRTPAGAGELVAALLAGAAPEQRPVSHRP